MIERIVKNKRISKCVLCDKKITTDYKVRHKGTYSKSFRHYHLSCYLKSVLSSIRTYKELLSKLNKSKRKLNKYKRHIMLENL